MTISLDGNFGLCRKKAAGCSVQAPLSKATMFLEQSGVDEFITNYTYPVPRGVRVSCMHEYHPWDLFHICFNEGM